jgi:hypothetical protein
LWAEASLAAVSTALLVLTLLWPDWIERVIGLDPDHGSGTAEWFVVAGTAAVAVTSAAFGWADIRRLRRVVA